ncbi:hypothetical protein EVAR_84412_1, partial [Eumeta japonica]
MNFIWSAALALRCQIAVAMANDAEMRCCRPSCKQTNVYFKPSRSLDSIKIMNEVSKFERAINELRNAVPPPSPKKKRRPDDVNHSVMRKE